MKLPSTNLLVSFEAAARLLSFKLAAEELYVTPSAISHQVRALEKELEVKLFVRSNRNIALSPQGQHFYEQIHQPIRQLKAATQSIRSTETVTKLVIHSIPYLTEQLLIPNIQSLKSLFPNLEIVIESKIEKANLNRAKPNELHVALRLGHNATPGLINHKISDVYATPVCTPEYLAAANLTQLNLTSDKHSWRKWQREWQTEVEFIDTIHCDSYTAVLNMAEQGLGLAMAYYPLLKAKVENNTLVEAFPNQITQLGSLSLVYVESDINASNLAKLKNWLTAVFTEK